MQVSNALAGVAVHDLDRAKAWYERLLGDAGSSPMPEVVEWKFSAGGALQVFKDATRAGKSSVTFVVTDIDAQVARLRAAGVQIGRMTDTTAVKTVMLKDEDDNQVVLAQPKGSGVVS